VHGNFFLEKCEACGQEYPRDFEVETVGFKVTPTRRCTRPVRRGCLRHDGTVEDMNVAEECGGRLRDMTLDWESTLPVDEYLRAVRETRTAKLVICLGTSLRITPICEAPQKVRRRDAAGTTGRMVIVNLQRTKKDERASMIIHAPCDDVMHSIVRTLALRIPIWERWDTMQYTYAHAFGGLGGGILEVRVCGPGGAGCPIPWLESVRVIIRATGSDSEPPAECSSEMSWIKSRGMYVTKYKMLATCLPVKVELEMTVKMPYAQLIRIVSGESDAEKHVQSCFALGPKADQVCRLLGDEKRKAVVKDGRLVRLLEFEAAKGCAVSAAREARFLGDICDVQHEYDTKGADHQV